MLEQDFKVIIKQNRSMVPKHINDDDFLQTMQKVFQFSCIFGVFGSRKFTTCLWCAFVLCSLIYITGNGTWKVIKPLIGLGPDTEKHRSVAARYAGVIFYSIAILALFLVSKLYYFWPDLAAAWTKAEKTMTIKIPVDKMLKKRMFNAFTLWLVCLILDHLFGVVALLGIDCPRELILRRYSLYSHSFMILNEDYAEWYAIPFFINNTIGTLLWNFQDLLIVLISIGLTSRYRRLNQCLASLCAARRKQLEIDKKTESAKLHTWRGLRQAYVKQAFLVRKVDSAIGGIIVLSCVSNFYFICLQLFIGITQVRTNVPMRSIYYLVSLLWLGFRMTSVVLAASEVNIYSQLALNDIYTYDTTHGYNLEVDRLRDQLSKDYIALSGMGFFHLHKTSLLQMAGAIITYELVLIQFDNRES